MTDTSTTQIVTDGTTTVSIHTDTTYVVEPTGVLDVTTGGKVTGASVDGGTEQVLNGGVAVDSTIGPGAVQLVYNARVIDTVLQGYQQVLSNGLSIGTVIENGGEQYVGADGTAKTTTVLGGGLQYVAANGTSKGTIIYDDGYQYDAGTATNTKVEEGGTQEVVGTAKNTIIYDGGTQIVDNGGLATGTTVQTGGFQQVIDASVKGTELSGTQQILTDGVAKNTVIWAGGNEYVGAGGVSNGSVVSAGALEYVAANGDAESTKLDGGIMFVAAGGLANHTKVVGDGTLDLQGTAQDTQLYDGIEYVYAGGTQQNVNFNGPDGALYLEEASSLIGTVSHFQVGDVIDLLGVSTVSFGFDHSKLTLATNAGTYTYDFANIEKETAFTVGSDGHGGTAISLALLAQDSAGLVTGSGLDQAPPHQDVASTAQALVYAQT